MDGPKRFSELRRLLPGVTQRMLTLQLRELESDGLLTRTVYPQVPPRVDYAATPLGKSFDPILMAMRDWGRHYKKSKAFARRRAASIQAGQ